MHEFTCSRRHTHLHRRLGRLWHGAALMHATTHRHRTVRAHKHRVRVARRHRANAARPLDVPRRGGALEVSMSELALRARSVAEGAAVAQCQQEMLPPGGQGANKRLALQTSSRSYSGVPTFTAGVFTETPPSKKVCVRV